MRARERRATVTLGAQGLVHDGAGRVLLIRHTYRPGWHFPGGGVERLEPVQLSLARELEEEAGVFLNRPAVLFGLYANFELFPGDHVALFIVADWSQPKVPAPNNEIAEQGFFDWRAPPAEINPRTLKRLLEFFGGCEKSIAW